MIFQAYLAKALLFKSRSVALSSSVQGRGLVKGDRDRDFRGEVFFVVGWVVDFLFRQAFGGGSTAGAVAFKVDGKGM